MPAVVGAEVGESDDLAAEEDFYAVVELAESAGGEPEEFRKHYFRITFLRRNFNSLIINDLYFAR